MQDRLADEFGGEVADDRRLAHEGIERGATTDGRLGQSAEDGILLLWTEPNEGGSGAGLAQGFEFGDSIAEEVAFAIGEVGIHHALDECRYAGVECAGSIRPREQTLRDGGHEGSLRIAEKTLHRERCTRRRSPGYGGKDRRRKRSAEEQRRAPQRLATRQRINRGGDRGERHGEGGSEVQLLHLRHRVVTGTRSQRHIGQRRIHAGIRRHARTIRDEYVFDAVYLVEPI